MEYRHLFLTIFSTALFLSGYAFADCESCGAEQSEEQTETCSCNRAQRYYYNCRPYQRSCIQTEETVVEPMWPSRREQHQLWDEITR